MKALRIDWHESESGWGVRLDGYSFHATPQAAQQYLSTALAKLPEQIPDEYSFPSRGWREPAQAVMVEIAESGFLAKGLADGKNLRVYRSFADSPCSQEYKEACSLQVIGNQPIEINYGEQGYTPAEQELLDMRREIETNHAEGKISPARAIAQSQAAINYLTNG